MSKLEKRTILLNSLFSFASSMVSSFISVYLYKYADSLVIMAIYTIIRIALFPPFFILGSKITQKHSFMVTYACGLFLMTCCMAYALLATPLLEKSGYYVLIAAAITGAGEGFYWFSANTCNVIVSTLESRANFLSYNGIFTNITSFLSPFAASFILSKVADEMIGYRIMLVIIIVIYLGVIAVSSGIHKKSEDKNISIMKALSMKDPTWRDHQVAVFFYGFRNSLTLILTSLLVYNAAGGSGIYSKLQTAFCAIAILSYRVISRFLRKDKISRTFLIGVFMTASSTIVLVLFSNLFGAIYFGVVNALGSVFFDNSYNYLSANIISSYKEEMTARVVARETALSIGRCIGMSFIVLCNKVLPADIYLQVAVITLSLFPIVTEQLLIKHR